MNRIEEFLQEGKNIIYFDFSGLGTDQEFKDLINLAKIEIVKHPPDSIYTITNMEGVTVSTNTYGIISKWMTFNKPYVKFGVVCGADATKKVIGRSAAVVSQRSNIVYVSSKEEAINYIMNLDCSS